MRASVEWEQTKDGKAATSWEKEQLILKDKVQLRNGFFWDG